DGVQDAGEPGIVGATVELRWFGPNGVEGDADDSVVTTVTGADGSYLFSGLPLGSGAANYRVRVTALPNGLTIPTAGLATVSLTSGVNRFDVDFGFRGPGSIGDRVWYDLNRDGVDTGEPGVAGVTLNVTWFGFDGVFGTADDLAYTATTNANGNYGLTGLPL